jgi:hypothetical protein
MPATSNNRAPTSEVTPERPEFAVTLGLLPPYTIEDVKRAYLEKVKDAHPDRGGDRAEFDRIQRAYEQGNEYLRFRSDRRNWIAARMEEYLAVEALLGKLRALGADVDTLMLDWVRRSFGDFANLTESIVGVRMVNAANAAELVDAMIRDQAILPALKRLELPGCQVIDRLAMQLRVFKRLEHLDLSHTAITEKALAVVDFLPELTSMTIDGTSVGWWSRRRMERTLRRRRAVKPPAVVHPTNIR